MRSFLTFVLALFVPLASAQTHFIFDGSILQPAYSDPQETPCKRWTIWYFKRFNTAHIPGTQWGSSTDKSLAKILADRERSLENEAGIESTWKKFGFKYTPPVLTYTNSVGPICLVGHSERSDNTEDSGKTGRSNKTERSDNTEVSDKTDEELKQLDGSTKTLLDLSRTLRMLLEASKDFPDMRNGGKPGPPGLYVPYSYIDPKKSAIEEFMSLVQKSLADVHSLKDRLSRLTGPSLKSIVEAGGLEIRHDDYYTGSKDIVYPGSFDPDREQLTNLAHNVQSLQAQFPAIQKSFTPEAAPTTSAEVPSIADQRVAVGAAVESLKYTFSEYYLTVENFIPPERWISSGKISISWSDVSLLRITRNPAGVRCWILRTTEASETSRGDLWFENLADAKTVCNFLKAKTGKGTASSCEESQ